MKAANGAGSVYYRPEKGLHVAAWVFDGKRYYVTSKDEATAIAKRDKAMARQLAGNAARESRIRVEDFYTHWEKEVLPYATTRKGKPLAPGTLVAYSNAIANQVVPVLGPKPLITVRESDIERVFNRMRDKGYSSNYINQVHKGLIRFLRDAKKAGHIDRVPLEDVVPPHGVQPKDKVVPDTPTFLALLDAAGEDRRMRAFIATIGYLGLRISEATGIRWADYSAEAGTITVMGKGSKPRTLKIGVRLRAELDAWRREQARERMASPWWSDENYMLASGVGTRWDAANARKAFKVIADPILPGCTPHSLRHYNATALLDAGVPIDVISEHLGHADTSVTSKVYIHVTKKLLAEVADVMDRVAGQ